MSPERIEDLIAVPIERKAREIAEIDDINTLISTGSTVIKLAVHDSVPKNKVDEVQQDVRNKMADIANSLPKGTRGPFVNTSYGNVAIVSVSITGEGYSYAELSDEAEELQEHLYTLDGVGRVFIVRGTGRKNLPGNRHAPNLAAVGVEIQQVLSDLQSQNVILPAGELDAGGTSLVLEANGDLKDVESVRKVLTKISGLSGFVRLEDLLHVRRGYVEPKRKPVYFKGNPRLWSLWR